jgi:ABC-type amino acid transport substrate-binding protein
MNLVQRAKEKKTKRLSLIGIVTIIGLTMLCSYALAGPTMDKIKETGILKMGFREGSISFAFIDPKVGKHVGFSVDMAGLLAENLGKRFGKEITIKPFTVTPKNQNSDIAERYH